MTEVYEKMVAGKGAKYERWIKIFNLEEATVTLNFLIKNALSDYDEPVA